MSVPVPHASSHIEVKSEEDAAVPSGAESPSSGAGRAMVLLRPSGPGGQVVLAGSPGAGPASAAGAEFKYMLTGLPGSLPAAADGGTSVRSPVVYTAGETVKAHRARQILKKRMTLDHAQKKYAALVRPVTGAVPTAAVAPPTPVVICEPEGGTMRKKGRTLFFVAKPPAATESADSPVDDEGQQSDPVPVPVIPAGSQQSPSGTLAIKAEPAAGHTALDEDLGVLKTLSKYHLSEKYEILPPPPGEAAEEIIHKLRCQNLGLKTELVRLAIQREETPDLDAEGLSSRRGRKKATALVTVERLRELEKIEAGMHSLFTPSQVKTLSREYKKNSVQWKQEDFRRAVGLLEASSIRAFNYVRREMLIPLPSIGTLKLRCPLHPDLNARFEAVLRTADARCRTCGTITSDGSQQGELQLQVQQDYHLEPAGAGQQSWVTPQQSLLRKRKGEGGASAAKKARQTEQQGRYQEPTVFFEDQVVVARSPAKPRGRGRGRGRGKRAPPPEPEPEQEMFESESMSEEEFDDEYGNDGVDAGQGQAGYDRYPTQYAGWNEWDPRQLN